VQDVQGQVCVKVYLCEIVCVRVDVGRNGHTGPCVCEGVCVRVDVGRAGRTGPGVGLGVGMRVGLFMPGVQDVQNLV
jgi:hypothetical protein